MYMSRKAIRTAAVDKVNGVLGWNCGTVEEIKFAIGLSVENARKVNQAIDDLKVCDIKTLRSIQLQTARKGDNTGFLELVA